MSSKQRHYIELTVWDYCNLNASDIYKFYTFIAPLCNIADYNMYSKPQYNNFKKLKYKNISLNISNAVLTHYWIFGLRGSLIILKKVIEINEWNTWSRNGNKNTALNHKNVTWYFKLHQTFMLSNLATFDTECKVALNNKFCFACSKSI